MQRYRLVEDTMNDDHLGRWVKFDDAMDEIQGLTNQNREYQAEIARLKKINREQKLEINEQARIIRRAAALARGIA